MTDDEKAALRAKLYDEITEVFMECRDDLYEAGVPDKKYQMPAYSDSVSLRKLESVRRALHAIRDGEERKIFQTARDLHPPGVQRRWANDELMRDTRETRIYVSACRLFRELWFTNTTLKSFFTHKP